MTLRPNSECSISEIQSGDYFERLARLPAGDGALPLAGSIELTHRCSLRCPHCYLPSTGSTNELSPDDWHRVLGRLAEGGVLFLLFTGGDPLLRNDFRRIYEAAHGHGFIITLFTNGTLLDESVAELLANRLPRRVELTVYGCTAGTWDAVTGTTGMFPAFERGLRLLSRYKIPFSLKMLLVKNNLQEVDLTRRLAQSLGTTVRFDPVVTARIDGDTSPTHLRIPEKDAVACLFESSSPAPQPALPSQTTPSPLFRCGAGVRTFNIDPAGRIHPCLMWRSDGYPLLGSAPDEWSRMVTSVRNRCLPSDTPCSACDIRAQCPACPAIALLETGHADAPVPFFCSMRSVLRSGKTV